MTPDDPPSAPVAVPCGEGVLFLIEPPAGWVMASPTPPARLVLLDATSPGPFWPNINLVVQELGKLTVEEFLTLSRLQMKAKGDTIVVERDEPIGSAAGGHLFEFLSYTGPIPVRCRQQIVFDGGRAYILTALAPSQQFETYRARFERAFGSAVLRVSGRE